MTQTNQFGKGTGREYAQLIRQDGKCQRCGFDEVGALTFHHVDPEEREFTILGVRMGKEKMYREVCKCLLLCENCHALHHSPESDVDLSNERPPSYPAPEEVL